MKTREGVADRQEPITPGRPRSTAESRVVVLNQRSMVRCEDLADARLVRLNEGSSGFDGHLLSHVAQLKLHVDSNSLVHLENERAAQVALESLSLRRNLAGPDEQVRKDERSRFIGSP